MANPFTVFSEIVVGAVVDVREIPITDALAAVLSEVEVELKPLTVLPEIVFDPLLAEMPVSWFEVIFPVVVRLAIVLLVIDTLAEEEVDNIPLIVLLVALLILLAIVALPIVLPDTV